MYNVFTLNNETEKILIREDTIKISVVKWLSGKLTHKARLKYEPLQSRGGGGTRTLLRLFPRKKGL